MNRRPQVATTAAVLIVVLLGGCGLLVRQHVFGPTTITAYFTKAIAIYPGDTVQIAGVTVGQIDAIEALGTQTKMTLSIDHGIGVPGQANAVIVSQNLVSARYVELTPAYESGSGPIMPSGGVIPLDRTAVPVEWDQVKDQLMRLTSDLGPQSGVSSTSVSRFIDSAATALDGNGDKLRETLNQLSQASRLLADGSGDIVDIITNLQTFVTALKASNIQIVEFQGRFASLTSVLDENRSDIDAALTDLSSAIGEVKRFIAGSRDQTSEQVQRLANVTQNLVDHRADLSNLLHVAPNALANAYNIYNPDTGTVAGSFVMTPLASPINLVCGAIGALENITAPETAKLCAQYLGPALNAIRVNGLPFPVNPFLAPSANPDNIVYADPNLAPGGSGPAPVPPEQPLVVSAYQPQAPATLPQMLLPTEPPPPADAPPAPVTEPTPGS